MSLDRNLLNKLFVGNLSYSTESSDLEELFKGVGVVRSVRMVTDRETGRPKGFGFVEMDSAKLAEDAIDQLNETDFMGRRIIVSKANPPRSRDHKSDVDKFSRW